MNFAQSFKPHIRNLKNQIELIAQWAMAAPPAGPAPPRLPPRVPCPVKSPRKPPGHLPTVLYPPANRNGRE